MPYARDCLKWQDSRPGGRIKRDSFMRENKRADGSAPRPLPYDVNCAASRPGGRLPEPGHMANDTEIENGSLMRVTRDVNR